MMRVDMNSDLGEKFRYLYVWGMDEAVLTHVTSANVACGWHAGGSAHHGENRATL